MLKESNLIHHNIVFVVNPALAIAPQEPFSFAKQKGDKAMTEKEQKKLFAFRIAPSEAVELQALAASRGVTVTALLMQLVRRELAEAGYTVREDKHRRPNGSTPPAPRRPRGRPRKNTAN